MSKNQQELLQLQTNAEEVHKENSNLSEREYIENTPFWIIMQNDKWWLTMAGYRITEEYRTKEEALERLEIDKWKIVMHIALIISEKKPTDNNK